MRITQNITRQEEAAREVFEGWLHQCWQLLEDGRPLQPDPFYERNDKLTPEVVRQAIAYIEEALDKEFAKYPNYHNRAQEIEPGEKLVTPGFDKLPYAQQRAIVQGVDRIIQKYKAEPEASPASAAPDPTDAGAWEMYNRWSC